ncbi:MAG: hypothetical protein IT371_22440 [Deltaproteobacteria bacterium]|nr:hypothetical protein [Deltaproteobacteria bacterium]
MCWLGFIAGLAASNSGCSGAPSGSDDANAGPRDAAVGDAVTGDASSGDAVGAHDLSRARDAAERDRGGRDAFRPQDLRPDQRRPDARARDGAATRDSASVGSCGPGLTCQPGQPCGTYDGQQAMACECGASGTYACGTPLTPLTMPCPTAPTPPQPCAPLSVLCVSTGLGGCSMTACAANGLGAWHGGCQLTPRCPAAAVCGTGCNVPGASLVCSCIKSVLNPSVKTPCSCMAVGPTSAWICT